VMERGRSSRAVPVPRWQPPACANACRSERARWRSRPVEQLVAGAQSSDLTTALACRSG
jgi:hypothetical protein